MGYEVMDSKVIFMDVTEANISTRISHGDSALQSVGEMLYFVLHSKLTFILTNAFSNSTRWGRGRHFMTCFKQNRDQRMNNSPP